MHNQEHMWIVWMQDDTVSHQRDHRLDVRDDDTHVCVCIHPRILNCAVYQLQA